MKFCPYCGKQLADNETCSCRQQAGAQGQQGGQAQQFNGQAQQFNGQAQQFNGQGQQFNGQAQQKENEAVASIVTLVKGMIKTPVTAISEFVKKGNALASVILIVIFSIIEMILAGISILSSKIKYSSYDYDYDFSSGYYNAKTILNKIFSNVIGEIVDVLIIAVVVMLVVNAFQKTRKVAFTQALAVACLYNIIYLPFILVGKVIALIPVKFFGYLCSWIGSFASGAGYVYTFLGIRSVEEDDNSMPLVYATATAVAAVCSTVINLIF